MVSSEENYHTYNVFLERFSAKLTFVGILFPFKKKMCFSASFLNTKIHLENSEMVSALGQSRQNQF